MDAAFIPTVIPLRDVRPGDVLVWKRGGLLAWILAHLIHWLKEPDWQMWGWHTTPVVAWDKILDAQMPRLKVVTIDSYLSKGRECRAYRVVPVQPRQNDLDSFTAKLLGKPYDGWVYVWTALSKCFGFFRIIDRRYNCWETTWAFFEAVHFDALDHSEYDPSYPWLPDFLRCVGELPLKGDSHAG